MTDILPFAAPSLADVPAVRFAAGRAQGSDLSAANIYLLQRKYQTEVAVVNGVLYRHYGGNARLVGYAFPCCDAGELSAALVRVEQDAAARGRAARFCLLTDEQRSALESLRPGRYVYATDPGDADYIYRRSDLVELPGTAYHKKRNHIARYLREHPDWRFAPLTEANAPDALAVADAWLAAADGDAPALRHERAAIAHALDCLVPLQLGGGILYEAGAPVAMAIASRISPDVADVHYEKTHPEHRDAYPLINRETAAALAPCHFVNREEDLNQPGLRQAKLSYRPALILRKHTATPC